MAKIYAIESPVFENKLSAVRVNFNIGGGTGGARGTIAPPIFLLTFTILQHILFRLANSSLIN